MKLKLTVEGPVGSGVTILAEFIGDKIFKNKKLMTLLGIKTIELKEESDTQFNKNVDLLIETKVNNNL